MLVCTGNCMAILNFLQIIFEFKSGKKANGRPDGKQTAARNS